MRKKATVSDVYYIQQHGEQTPEEISEAIELDLQVVLQSYKKKKVNKLGRSKVNTLGGPIYQMTEDLDKVPRKKVKSEKRNLGIYRSEENDG